MSFEEEAMVRHYLPLAKEQVQARIPQELRLLLTEQCGMTADRADVLVAEFMTRKADVLQACAEQYARAEFARHMAGWLNDADNAWGDTLPMIEMLRDADEAKPH